MYSGRGLVSININELRELLSAIAQTQITEFTLKSEDFELTIRQGETAIPTTKEQNIVSAPAVTPIPSPEITTPSPKTELGQEPSNTPIDKKWVAIPSPMVGTFYRAPAPDESSFVEVNDRIQAGQTVCIIEAMKLMNEIETEISGQVMEIAVGNGEPVEYGQTLMWVNPD